MTKTPQELANYLRMANIWRRSNIDDPMPEPTELGEAIDQAIEFLEERSQLQTATPQEKHAQGYAYSKCCDVRAVTAGGKSAGSTCWYVCTDCRKPCDIVFRDSNTQPL